MMMYMGMNQRTGEAITDIDHIRQSVRDILTTPVGSRIYRREYGSLFLSLIDDPTNPATKLRVMAATYSAINRWEPRIRLDSVTLETTMDGEMVVELSGYRDDGSAVSLSVPMGNNL
ncbi:GPW/gp25 family protein [Atlantibacter hermannii]|uniref:GPW/gp25 family protein n=2 Tax=Atlantibacter hermannii TaxID=565 RepID=UPI002896DE3B|nr:GPW/gp25 family protein [Atlantibacter hermannii]EDV0343373.1 baseplate assembly protein [Salmonella enterica subsp. enterica serovar Minnesota]